MAGADAARVGSEEAADGRVQRRARTRSAVVEALLELLDAGVLRPTASQVADLAGVSLRSVGQNFGTQEQLFREAAEVLVARVAASLRPAPASFDRIEALVARRAAFAEATANVRRAAALLSGSEVVDATGKLWRHDRRAELARVFDVDFAGLEPAARRDAMRALEGAVSAALWDELRSGMRLSRADAERAMVAMVRALIESFGRPKRTRGGT